MVRMELLKVDKSVVTYKYFPESSSTFGIVSLDVDKGYWEVKKLHEEYAKYYAYKAVGEINKMHKRGEGFPEKTTVCWY